MGTYGILSYWIETYDGTVKMNRSNENIKIAYIETYDGKRSDLSIEYLSLRNPRSWFQLDRFIYNRSKFEGINIKDIKKIYIYETLPYELGVEKITFCKPASDIEIEEVRLPNGIKRLSCGNYPDIAINKLYIPYSLEGIECFNDVGIIGFDDCMEYGNLKEVELLDRETV